VVYLIIRFLLKEILAGNAFTLLAVIDRFFIEKVSVLCRNNFIIKPVRFIEEFLVGGKDFFDTDTLE